MVEQSSNKSFNLQSSIKPKLIISPLASINSSRTSRTDSLSELPVGSPQATSSPHAPFANSRKEPPQNNLIVIWALKSMAQLGAIKIFEHNNWWKKFNTYHKVTLNSDNQILHVKFSSPTRWLLQDCYDTVLQQMDYCKVVIVLFQLL